MRSITIWMCETRSERRQRWASPSYRKIAYDGVYFWGMNMEKQEIAKTIAGHDVKRVHEKILRLSCQKVSMTIFVSSTPRQGCFM